MNPQQTRSTGDGPLLRRFEYEDGWIVAADLGADAENVSVDTVGETAIVVIEGDGEPIESEFELPGRPRRPRSRTAWLRWRASDESHRQALKTEGRRAPPRGDRPHRRRGARTLRRGHHPRRGTGRRRDRPRLARLPPEDDGTGVVRIDGRLRQEADVGIDDRVTVESVDVSRAESVTIAFPSQLRVRGQISPFIRDKLSGQPVTEGQTIRTSLGFGLMGGQSQAVPMKVASTTPREPSSSPTTPRSKSRRSPQRS